MGNSSDDMNAELKKSPLFKCLDLSRPAHLARKPGEEEEKINWRLWALSHPNFRAAPNELRQNRQANAYVDDGIFLFFGLDLLQYAKKRKIIG